MGIRARIDSEKEKLRETILQATLELLSQEGYEALSIRKVAARIGYSPTTIYLYFKNKAELVEKVIDEGFGRFMCELQSQTPPPEISPLQELAAGMRLYIRFALQNPHWYRVTFSTRLGPANNDARFLSEEALGERGFAVMAQTLQRCMDAGEISPRPLHPSLQTLWATLHGVTTLLIDNPAASEEERQAVIETYIEMIMNGLILKKNNPSPAT